MLSTILYYPKGHKYNVLYYCYSFYHTCYDILIIHYFLILYFAVCRGGFSGFSETSGYEPIELTLDKVADIHHSGGNKQVMSCLWIFIFILICIYLSWWLLRSCLSAHFLFLFLFLSILTPLSALHPSLPLLPILSCPIPSTLTPFLPFLLLKTL